MVVSFDVFIGGIIDIVIIDFEEIFVDVNE